MINQCLCRCHGQSSTFGSCSIPGGCGHLHTDDPSQRCYRQQRCADARTRTAHTEQGDRVRVPAWAVKPGGLCRMCEQVTRRAIEQLPADYRELGDLLGKTTGSPDASTGGTRELPVPIRLTVEALQTAVLDEAERWAEAVAAVRGEWYEPAGTRDSRIAAAAARLAGDYDRFLALPPTDQQRLDPTDECVSGKDATMFTVESGLDGALALLKLHEQVVAVAGRTHRAQRLWTPCPQKLCQRLTLEHPEGADYVECRRCGNRLSYDKYEKLATILANAHGGTAA
jgi:hypothetical protein